MISQALNAFFLWREITFQYFCSSITTAGAKTISIWLVLWLEGTNPPGGETRNPQLRQDYRIIPSMSQNCLKFWDKFETKLRTDLRPYRDNLETYLTILLLRANWDIFETWVHSVAFAPLQFDGWICSSLGPIQDAHSLSLSRSSCNCWACWRFLMVRHYSFVMIGKATEKYNTNVQHCKVWLQFFTQNVRMYAWVKTLFNSVVAPFKKNCWPNL